MRISGRSPDRELILPCVGGHGSYRLFAATGEKSAPCWRMTNPHGILREMLSATWGLRLIWRGGVQDLLLPAHLSLFALQDLRSVCALRSGGSSAFHHATTLRFRAVTAGDGVVPFTTQIVKFESGLSRVPPLSLVGFTCPGTLQTQP